MADTTRLVRMIALIIIGVLVAAWGIIYIWLYRSDQLVLQDLKQKGTLTAQDVARLTNPTWIWVLSVIQIVLGVGLVIWGIFQYAVKSEEEVVSEIAKGAEKIGLTFRGNPSGPSRRTFTTTTTSTQVPSSVY